MAPNPLNLPDEGDVLQAVGYEIELRRRKVADLILPTGRLVVCDPWYTPETEPFEVQTPTGRFPVYAVVADMRDGVRTAYGVVEFSDQRPHRWEIAHLAGEEPSKWNGHRSVFHVESNVAAIMDDQTADVLLNFVHYGDPDEVEELEKEVSRDMWRTHKATQIAVADVRIDPRTGGNLVGFDVDVGTYATYLGFDGDDDICMVVLDFEVLDYQFTPFGLRY
jgi:hypothetical protein